MARTSDSELLDPLFIDRWSPRSFSDEPVTDEQLAALFEAARWAPSWMNNQPWVFFYETDGPDRAAMEELIMDFNKPWSTNAPVIGLIASRSSLEGFMARSSEFDTGAAVMSLTHQAHMLGLHVHLMGGIEVDMAFEKTGLDPEETNILAAFSIGHIGDPADLPEKLQEREAPSDRMPVASFAFKGLTAQPRPSE